MFFCSICYKAEELRIRNTTTSHELISGSASHEQNGQDELNGIEIIYSKDDDVY